MSKDWEYKRECSHGDVLEWKECPECREYLVRQDTLSSYKAHLIEEIQKLEFEKVSDDGHTALISKPEVISLIKE
jgi:hypothetical protein